MNNKKLNEKRLWKLISQHQLAIIELEDIETDGKTDEEIAIIKSIRQECVDLYKRDLIELAKGSQFSYSVALYLLKNGLKVSRSGWGWNGTSVYLQVQFPDENSKMTLPYIYMVKRVIADDGSYITKYFPCPTSDEINFANDWILSEA